MQKFLFPPDMEKEFRPVYRCARNFTMTSIERMYAMYKATKYINEADISGDIVECGVWKGGSSMIAAITLIKAGDTKRKIYLYDTYEGMTKPTKKDVGAMGKWREKDYSDDNYWCICPLESVKKNLYSTDYPKKNLIFIKGPVEDTIPKVIPKKIALLRLDTDWYDSTYHELKHLYPLVSRGGVIIIDDYGHWRGARQAVDDFFMQKNVRCLLNRIDYTGRIFVKQA